MAYTTSQVVAGLIVKDALSLIPSLAPADTFSQEKLDQLLGEFSGKYKPNSTFGLLTSRLEEPACQALESLGTEPEFIAANERFQEEARSVSSKVAKLTSDLYGLLTTTAVPAAEGMVTKIMENLQALEARTPDQVAVEDKLVMYNWGALAEPANVIAITNTCLNEANAFIPGRDVEEYHINGCISAASQYVPEKVLSREGFTAINNTLADGAEIPNTVAYFVTSPATFNHYIATTKDRLTGSGESLVGCVTELSLIYDNLNLCQKAIESLDTFSPALAAQISSAKTAATLLLGAAQAARQTRFEKSLYLGESTEGLIVNDDLTASFESHGYTPKDLVTTYRHLRAKKFMPPKTGFQIDLALAQAAPAKKKFEEDVAAREELADIEAQQQFQRVVRQVVGEWNTEYKSVESVADLPVPTQQAINTVSIEAVREDASLGDTILKHVIAQYDRPDLTLMDKMLRAELGNDRSFTDLEVSTGRTRALESFVYSLVTRPKYLV